MPRNGRIMTNLPVRSRRPARLDHVLVVTLLILSFALAVLWARAIVYSAPADPTPPPTAPLPTATPPSVPVQPVAAVSTPAPTRRPTRTPNPTITASPVGMAAQSPLPTPQRCTETAGQAVTGSFTSRVSGGETRYRVYVPPCYYQTDRRYPSIYLIHGSADNESHFEDLGLFDVMDQGLAGLKFAPAIIVLPDGDQNLYLNTSGGPNSYEGQIINELVPLIDRTYRTDARAAMRAIGGISRGGVWSLEIGFLHPELFGIVAGHSAALNVNEAPPSLDPIQLVNLPSLKTQRLWLDVGDADYTQPGVEQLHQALDANQVSHIYQIYSGAHEDTLWAAHLADYLAFYTQSWPRQ